MKRVLIVNAFIDEYRRTRGSPHRVPRAMGPPYLAGVFAPERWDIRLYNEQYSGLLTDATLLGWPDLLVLTGVNTSFDRMKQLTGLCSNIESESRGRRRRAAGAGITHSVEALLRLRMHRRPGATAVKSCEKHSVPTTLHASYSRASTCLTAVDYRLRRVEPELQLSLHLLLADRRGWSVPCLRSGFRPPADHHLRKKTHPVHRQ